MAVIVAILAGGRSKRMGRAKPPLRLAGRPLLSYPLAAARTAGLEAWVIAKRGSELPPLDCRVLLEPPEPVHPLCGIVAALRAAGSAPVIAVGGDMPFVAWELLAWLASRRSTTAVQAGGRLQPLLARYDPDALEPLEWALIDGKPATTALQRLDPHVLGEAELRRFGDPDRLCFNVNTPADLELAADIAATRT